MSAINRQRFLAELSKLLGFMSTRDRQEALKKYSDMFDNSASEDEVIQALGSPTKLAISIAREYVPSQPPEPASPPERKEPERSLPGEQKEPEPEPAPDTEPHKEAPQETADAQSGAAPDAPGPVFDGDGAMSPELLGAVERAVDAAASEIEEIPEEPEDEMPKAKKRRAKPAVLVIYVILSLLIGLPVAVILIIVGIPFLAVGGGAIAGTVYAAMQLIPELNMFSDILLVAGAGIIISGLGLLLAWLGVFISISLGGAWIGGVVLRLGNRVCFQKEAPEQ